ncbi:MAG: hypothetical protein EOP82_05920 [Variovorax sp.]|nr:MAG: hypothetical protein EOP82_05920 [Variovorax sp.]
MVGPNDMRNGIDRLAASVQTALAAKPFCGRKKAPELTLALYIAARAPYVRDTWKAETELVIQTRSSA